MNIFDFTAEVRQKQGAPLAERMRPRTLQEFFGQGSIVGEGKLLSRLIAADKLVSVIFHGPPGTGKTTLAHIIAEHTRSHFVSLNAVSSGVADVRRVIEGARENLASYGRRTIIFIDESIVLTKVSRIVSCRPWKRVFWCLLVRPQRTPTSASMHLSSAVRDFFGSKLSVCLT